MTWYVQLTGHPSDLATLAESFQAGDVRIVHEDSGYFLLLADEAPDADSRRIHERGQRAAELLTGASKLLLDARDRIAVGSVHRSNDRGGRDIFLFPEPAVVHVRAGAPTLVITRADGTTEISRPGDPARDWLVLAASDESVATVLRLIGTRQSDWVNLYRIFEVVAADAGGPDAIASKDWASRSALTLFKRTANSPGALGLDARHGAETTEPPARPMSLPEARSLIDSLVQAWLRSKT